MTWVVPFLGGLAGSLHCIGMCGGFPLALAGGGHLSGDGFGVGRASVAAGRQHVDHLRAGGDPLGNAAGKPEVGVVRMGGHHQNARRDGTVLRIGGRSGHACLPDGWLPPRRGKPLVPLL